MEMDSQRPSEISSELSVLVPAFNEAGTIECILRRVRDALPDAEIIVVDDGSTDGTLAIAESLKEPLALRVIALQQNSGKGCAVKRGLEHATRRWVVIQDADLEYEPCDLQRLVAYATEGNRIAVYGSRYRSRGRACGGPWLNFIGVKLLALLEWILYGRWLSDPHTCYKMLRRDVFRSLDLQSSGFEMCAEINSKLLRDGVSIPEIPIHYTPRNAADGKKIRLSDFFIAVWTYVRYRFRSPASRTLEVTGENSARLGRGYLVSRLLIGCLLLIAGATKLGPLHAIPITPWLVLPKAFVFFGGITEFILGWMCLSLVPHRLLRQIIFGLFALFLMVLGMKWIAGEQSCECLGSMAMPLAWMAMIDGVALIALAWYRDSWGRPWMPQGSFLSEQVSNVRLVFPVLLIGCILWFGSLDAAKAFFAGDAVLVDSISKYAGDVRQNESVDIFYRLTNPTGLPLRVLGARSSCSCVAILDLPTTVEPGGAREIRLRVTGRKADTLQREKAELIFDDSALRVVLNATANVRPNR